VSRFLPAPLCVGHVAVTDHSNLWEELRPRRGRCDRIRSARAVFVLRRAGRTGCITRCVFCFRSLAAVGGRYGLNGDDYNATSCRVSVGHSEITCLTAPGAGTGMLWNLMIDGQASKVSTTDYAAPVISGFEGPGATLANTDGGQVWRCTACVFVAFVMALAHPHELLRGYPGWPTAVHRRRSSSSARTSATTSRTYRP